MPRCKGFQRLLWGARDRWAWVADISPLLPTGVSCTSPYPPGPLWNILVPIFLHMLVYATSFVHIIPFFIRFYTYSHAYTHICVCLSPSQLGSSPPLLTPATRVDTSQCPRATGCSSFLMHPHPSHSSGHLPMLEGHRVPFSPPFSSPSPRPPEWTPPKARGPPGVSPPS